MRFICVLHEKFIINSKFVCNKEINNLKIYLYQNTEEDNKNFSNLSYHYILENIKMI